MAKTVLTRGVMPDNQEINQPLPKTDTKGRTYSTRGAYMQEQGLDYMPTGRGNEPKIPSVSAVSTKQEPTSKKRVGGTVVEWRG